MAADKKFWGAEVKPRMKLSVTRKYVGSTIHISKVVLGDIKKVNVDDAVSVYVEVGGNKLIMGILSQNAPQLSFDLTFEDDFTIYHDCVNGCITLLGQQTGGGSYGSEFPITTFVRFN